MIDLISGRRALRALQELERGFDQELDRYEDEEAASLGLREDRSER